MRSYESNRRIRWMAPIICLVVLVIVGRLVQVQLLQRGRFDADSRQHNTALTARAARGRILDRNHNQLAVTRDVYSLCVYPGYYRDLAKRRDPDGAGVLKRQRALATLLARSLDVSEGRISAALAAPSGFVWVQRHAESQVIDAIEAALEEAGLGWWPRSGVDYVIEERRSYPRGALAAHVIGHTDLDGKGVDGIEHTHDDRLRSREFRQTSLRDGKGRAIDPVAVGETGRRTSETVVLTIDEHVQHIVEQELTRQVSEFRAASGVGIVMNPRNGEVLALANVPAYDLNYYNDPNIPEWVRRNRAIWWPYEPGSAFKVLTMAALIDSGRARPGDTIYCEEGVYVPRVGMKPIRDVHPYGNLTLTEVLEQSSNIGILKAASEHFSLAELRDYVHRFRLDATAGIDLPFERYGSTGSLADRSGYALFYVPWGQGISVTPLQMLMVVNVIANDGVMMQPRIVREVLRRDGKPDRLSAVSLGEIVSPQAARAVKEMMVGVVERGTGRSARIEGLRIAGKTGTSQKADPRGRGYLEDAFVSTFIGFFPAENPVYSMLMLIDEPQGAHYGGQVAAPAFQRIVRELVKYERMQPVMSSVASMAIADDKAARAAQSRASDRTKVDSL